MSVTINRRMRTDWHKDRMSGEEYSTQRLLSGYEVNGGFFQETVHMTLAGAEKEKALRETMNRKFPFVVPVSQREIDKAKRLGL
jgi:hypothetical protein